MASYRTDKKKTKRSRAITFAVAIVGRATTEWGAIEKIHNILICSLGAPKIILHLG